MSSSKRNRPSPLKSLSEIRSQLPTETHVRAWTIIYDAQRIAKIDTKDMMYAGITGHLLLELLRRRKALGITPSSQLVNEIVSIGYDDSERHQIVYRLGETYLHHLLRSFKPYRTIYPPRSSDSSRPSFEALEDQISATSKEQGSMSQKECHNYMTSRKMALARDGFRCVLTGIIDTMSADDNDELYQIAQNTRTDRQVLNTAHIFNSDIGEDLANKPNEIEYTAGVLGILNIFGLGDLADKLAHENAVDSPINLITLTSSLHSDFDHLKIWFDDTEIENIYTIECRDSDRLILELRGVKHRVDFRESPDTCKLSAVDRDLILPDRRLLALHAACARVAHMSGAAEIIDKWSSEAEESQLLLADGSSGELLVAMLSPFASYGDLRQ